MRNTRAGRRGTLLAALYVSMITFPGISATRLTLTKHQVPRHQHPSQPSSVQRQHTRHSTICLPSSNKYILIGVRRRRSRR
ncbi:uncharacterized protein B0T15DRAFT_534491 [Chaetomium strumarium]|uniref:Uncharacterized protein n=1 Tax=Chaetomium strumarium TaxID=1170767 RepID=A0AAJ0GU05_9PEZI|nr:hypothetical protein B0T15DRAFT_534491 [Chaetomium strumarium]